MTTAAEYWSLAEVGVSSSSCSGDRYGAVPTTVPVSVRRVCPGLRAMPKSVTLTFPSDANRTLAGVTSRWTMSRSCADSRAARTASATPNASGRGSAPWRARRSARVSPSTSSITMAGSPPSPPVTSSTVTTFGWMSDATMRASRRKRSDAEASAPACATFTATGRSVCVSWPRHTSPIPPRARRASRR